MATVQIRNFPDPLHKALKSRARKRGQSLSEYLRRELEELASKPSIDELFDRIDSQPALNKLSEPAWAAVENARKDAGRE